MNKIILGLIMSTMLWSTSWANKFEPQTKAIEIIVPFAPGGATDTAARMLSQMLVDAGWKSVVVNKPGGGAIIGANYVAKSPADGHTLLFSGNGIHSNLIFDSAGVEYTTKSFVPVAVMGKIGYTLYCNKDLPFTDYNGFKKYMRSNPDKFNISWYNYNTGNIFSIWAKHENLPKPQIIVQKGGGTTMIAGIVGGHIQCACDIPTAYSSYIVSEQVRVIAAFDKDTLKVVKKIKPDLNVPNINDTIQGLDFFNTWGLWAPAGTPESVLEELNQTINARVRTPKYKDQIDKLGVTHVGGPRQDLEKVRSSDLNTFTKLLLESRQ